MSVAGWDEGGGEEWRWWGGLGWVGLLVKGTESSGCRQAGRLTD